METRRSSRLRLAVNDSAKRRLSRFIRRNLDLMESNVLFTKKPNAPKNFSRVLNNPNQLQKSMGKATGPSGLLGRSASTSQKVKRPRTAESCTKNVNNQNESVRIQGRANDCKRRSSSSVSSRRSVSTEISEATTRPNTPMSSTTTLKNTNGSVESLGRANFPKSRADTSTPLRRSASSSKISELSTRRPITLRSGRRILKSPNNSVKSNGKQSSFKIPNPTRNSDTLKSSGRNLKTPNESAMTLRRTNSLEPLSRSNVSSKIPDRSIRRPSAPNNVCRVMKSPNKTAKGLLGRADGRKRALSQSASSSRTPDIAGRFNNTTRGSRRNSRSQNGSEGSLGKASSIMAIADSSSSSSSPSSKTPDLRARRPMTHKISSKTLKNSKESVRSQGTADSSMKTKDDSSVPSETLASSSIVTPNITTRRPITPTMCGKTSESSIVSSISLGTADSCMKTEDNSSESLGKPVSPSIVISDTSSLISSWISSISLETAKHGDEKSTSSENMLVGKSVDSNELSTSDQPKCIASSRQFDVHQKISDSRSEKMTKLEEPDLGLDTLKRTVVELFAGDDQDTTLPFIRRNWPERCGNNQPTRLPNPKTRSSNDSTGFLSLIDLKINRYHVQCQLTEAEWETMNFVAQRWNWTQDEELSPDTKYVIVKEESINQDFDRVPENALKANAFGGCVLLFGYVEECAAEDELVRIQPHHIPTHKGTRRKMLGRYQLRSMFDDFAFFITPEIGKTGHHKRDFVLLRNLLRLTRSKLCSSLDELRSSAAKNKVALRSTARSDSEDVQFVHYHWLYECLLNYKLYSLEPYTWDFTVY